MNMRTVKRQMRQKEAKRGTQKEGQTSCGRMREKRDRPRVVLMFLQGVAMALSYPIDCEMSTKNLLSASYRNHGMGRNQTDQTGTDPVWGGMLNDELGGADAPGGGKGHGDGKLRAGRPRPQQGKRPRGGVR